MSTTVTSILENCAVLMQYHIFLILTERMCEVSAKRHSVRILFVCVQIISIVFIILIDC